MKAKAITLTLTCFFNLAHPAFSQETPAQRDQRLSAEMGQWAKDCVSPCTLPPKFLEGGLGASFIFAAVALYDSGKALRVLGAPYCSSACAVLVDKLKGFGGDVCVQNGMRLRFHRGFERKPNPDGSRKLLDTTPSIAVTGAKSWVDLNGGIPADGSWIVIPQSVVSSQYGYCS